MATVKGANKPPVEFSIYGLLVNPKNAELFYCAKDGDKTFVICALSDDVVGEGFFNDTTSAKMYGESSQISGYPRVHTPAGVSTKGSGLGTVLYTALCLAAHEQFQKRMTIPGIDVSADGISSDGHRKQEASSWWKAAREKYGLAVQVEGCVSREKGFIRSVFSGSDKEKVCGLKADVYPYKNTKGLVVGSVGRNDYLLFSSLSPSRVRFTSDARKIIASLNTGMIRKYDKEKQKTAIEGILKLAQSVGVSVADRKGLVLRYTEGVDETTLRSNPSGRSRVVVKYYGNGMRSNPASPEAVAEVKRVHRMRESLGWAAFR